MASIHDLRDRLAEYEQSPGGVAHDLRLNFADIVYRLLAERNMTQSQLAKKAGIKPPYLTRIMHSSQNWTTEAAGRILWALGIHLELVEKPLNEVIAHGKEESENHVLNLPAAMAGLGMGVGGTRVPRLINSPRFSGYVGPELREKIENPLIFQGVPAGPNMPPQRRALPKRGSRPAHP